MLAFNRIMSATGKGFARVPKGSYDVYVSRGAEFLPVPELVGKNRSDVIRTLRDLGLEIGEVDAAEIAAIRQLISEKERSKS